MRFNSDLKAKCTGLRDVGKPTNILIVIRMQKLLATANALVEADRLWVEKRSCT